MYIYINSLVAFEKVKISVDNGADNEVQGGGDDKSNAAETINQMRRNGLVCYRFEPEEDTNKHTLVTTSLKSHFIKATLEAASSL